MDHISLIRDETDRFIDVIQTTEPTAEVRTCPDWDAAGLLWHYAGVHWFWAAILSRGVLTDEESEAIESEQPASTGSMEDGIALLRSSTDDLIAQLAARDDAQPAWSWFASDQTVGFTRRMQVYEATMHRIDAEGAAGAHTLPISPEVALGATEHAIAVMLAWWGTLPGFEFTPTTPPVALHATDVERTMLVRGGRWRGADPSGASHDIPGVILVESGEPVASWSGTADELARWWWGRGVEPTRSGDASALDTVREAQAQGIQ